MRRFFCARVTAGENILDEKESHHIRDVLRLKPGADVTLMDGEGRRADGTISGIGERVVVAVKSSAPVAARKSGISCAISFPKGRRGDYVVQKFVELETDVIYPLITSRTVCVPNKIKIERYKTIIKEATKQSGGRSALTIREPATLQEALASVGKESLTLVAEPSSDKRLSDIVRKVSGQSTHLVIIGPEGGLTGDEIESLKIAGAHFFSLGSSILRIETAAIVAVGIIRELIQHD